MDPLFSVLADLNPWRDSGRVPSVLAQTLRRPIASAMAARMQKADLRRFHVIVGPRRTGKTTILYQTIEALLAAVDPERLVYLHLDHPQLGSTSLGAMIKEIIVATSATLEKPVFLFLDEISYTGEWHRWLKTIYDERWPVHVLATSSAASVLQDGRQESGVGRWQEHRLPPFLFGECLELLGAEPSQQIDSDMLGTLEALRDPDEPAYLNVFLQIGGFPELLARELGAWSAATESTGSEYLERSLNRYLEAQRILRDDAIERSIHKDINQLYGIDRPQLLERLLYLLADRVAQGLEPTKICQELDGLSIPTFERYLGFLENAFLVFSLPNYSGLETSIQRRGRKVYFFDVAVRNAALLRSISVFSNPTEYGHLIENVAAAHLHALADHEQVRLFHWREGNKREVDLVYDHPTLPMAFELASGPQHDRSGLRAFSERFPRFRGRCFVVSTESVPTRPASQSQDGIGLVSLSRFLVAVSAHAQRAQYSRIAG